MNRKPARRERAVEIGCDLCSVLEWIRSSRQKRYRELEGQRRREPAKAGQLSEAMDTLKIELDQAQLKLTEHLGTHAVLFRKAEAC
jgi:hypothetical protein